MEMEDHHQYGMGDLRQFLNGRTSPGLFTAISQPTAELISSTDGHRHQLASHAQAQAQHYEMLISTPHQLTNDQITTMPPVRGGLLHHHHHHHQLFRSDSSATGTSTAPNNNTLSSGSGSGCLDMDQNSGFGFNGGGNGTDGGTGRWPRQETLTLLEIRSRLDSKFKEANQKGPLWDEVSRIMCEEHGHQRSGKKCREKFENLYKYYKKTKDGKAGRQDGKHYRFFRQLEALYGESSSNQEPTHLVGVGSTTFPPYTTQQPPNQEVFPQAPRNNICDDSFTPSNSSAFDTSSSDDCSDLNAVALKRRGKRSWKAKIRDFIDGKMRRLMEKQEAWLEKMMKSIEHKEQERVLREEEWRKQEAERIDREHKFWAKERAWIEARDAGLMEALHKLTGIKELKVGTSSPQTDQDQLLIRADNGCETITNSSDSWAECEITKLIQLRTSMESMFVQQSGINSGEEVLWEEIASNMACLGYENRSGKMCKEKWDSISNYIMKPKEECSKKRKENDNSMSRSCFYFQNNESISNNQGGGGAYREGNELGSLLTQSELHVNALSNSNPGGSTMQGSSSFRFFMGDQAENSWENYGLKLSKGDNN